MDFKINSKFIHAFKALRQLGLKSLGWYIWYQLGLYSGYLKWRTPGRQDKTWVSQAHTLPPFVVSQSLFPLPEKDRLLRTYNKHSLASVLREADTIVAGRVRIFGEEAVPLQLEVPGVQKHWTAYERRLSAAVEGDIKFFWEVGRFGWAYTLARAYYLSDREQYVEAFWRYTRQFLEANPPYLGVHWVSGQEVALRLMALVFAYQVFAGSAHTTDEDKMLLGWAIAAHAERIPPTLAYALSQNNNHLLSEAVGLYTASLALSAHPSASAWRRLGWRLFNLGVQSQVTPDGAYIQHSTNYHRLMLQDALWINLLASHVGGEQFPEKTKNLLATATHWLLSLLDPVSGHVPNLGPNDGAYILPLTACPFDDYRPVLKAASMAFMNEYPFGSGMWDEMSLWLADDRGEQSRIRNIKEKMPARLPSPSGLFPAAAHILQIEDSSSWAFLRSVRFTNRPGHADQLHLDMWWRGLNVAQDAGTYLYNASRPWDNALTHAGVHNTITVNGQDQMNRAGRFLYLDWAQAEVVKYETEDNAWISLTARHDGYCRLGLIHQRKVTAYRDGHWEIGDDLLPQKGSPNPSSHNKSAFHSIRLHWLLPDWPWLLEEEPSTPRYNLKLQSPLGWITIQVDCALGGPGVLQFVRAGELLHGGGEVSPTWGWVSPTYGCKHPALSLAVTMQGRLPLRFQTEWYFPSG